MNSKKVLALIMGAIIASSGMSQTAVQVYAHNEESSSSSEPMEDGLSDRELTRLENFTSRRANELLNGKSRQIYDLDILYVSESNLVFEPVSKTEVRLVCLDEEKDFNGNIVVPEEVLIDGEPYSVTSIGCKAFYDCENLESVTLPDSITRIGEFAFIRCRNLQLERLPKDLEIIGICAFSFCSHLNPEALPENLIEIGEYAFSNCKSLQLETLPDSIEKIGNNAFEFCKKLNLRELPKNLKIIDNYAFSNCRNLQLEKLPDSIEEIGNNAFEFCKKLNLRALPKNLKIIGANAFSECAALKLEEGLPKDLEIIDVWAFANTGIKTITIPASVTELGHSSFDTKSIEKINLAQGSRLTNIDIEDAYGLQAKRILMPERAEEKLILTRVQWNNEVANSKCAICQAKFKEESKIAKLPCGHFVDTGCLATQMIFGGAFQGKTTFTCPECEKRYGI